MTALTNIKVSTHILRGDLAIVRQQIGKWTQDKKDRFVDHWAQLEKYGACVNDVKHTSGELVCSLSEDFRRAIAEFEADG